MNTTSLHARDLSAFVKALGWVQVEEATKDGLFVFNHPGFDHQQLVFPLDQRFADTNEMMQRAITRLALLYNWSPNEAARRVEESHSEVLVSRVPDATVSLIYASQVLESQKELLLSGAVAVERRQAYYNKTLVGNAKRMLEATRFRHTEEGSFIFKSSCRLYEFEAAAEPPLFSPSNEPVAAPFVRRAMLNIGIGLQELMRSVHQRSEDKLVESIKEDAASPISANFCSAIAELRDREHPHDMELFVSWSPLLAPPPEAPQKPIFIRADDFPAIEEVAKALRADAKPKRNTYFATVEKLEGSFNDMGQREGRVLLELFSASDGSLKERITVRVTLDAAKYDEALEIHKTTKVQARVEGTIKPSQRQPFEFDLDSFTIISVQI